ncbi:hypothetical protein A7P95_02870 [Eikenella longinqua]|uniref:RNA polymerase subunit sigma-32 n=1 Tax=Eikenella longinqua TaxID=1795827 RepID=A0A1A9S0E2_9NEIS|nr:DUF2322 family protein [Eikenella longinqua]OAM29983.1 hypothetical protein A7P95_02870 [Eikenella longinqua]
MTTFAENLATFPSIDHLSGIDIQDAAGQTVHHIPAAPGKLGSLRLYYALAEKFANRLDGKAATQGLEWFAEHTADAEAHPGKHPNIDLLKQIIDNKQTLHIAPLKKQ